LSLLSTAVLAASVLIGGAARAAEPITIGFGMALTGGLAAGGKSALLAMQIWRDNVNAKGGLMGRPVKLINYDDQSNPATAPGIYTKLLDVDKVDFIVSGYGTNLIAPAMPVAISHDRMFLGLFGLAVNSEFHYPKYFSMLPTGPDPKHAFSEPFFQVAMAANPKRPTRRGRLILRRLSTRFRPPARTWCSSPPTRRVQWACCARRRKAG
jgi:branched-chain amino acid transport system substrate-binding protein